MVFRGAKPFSLRHPQDRAGEKSRGTQKMGHNFDSNNFTFFLCVCTKDVYICNLNLALAELQGILNFGQDNVDPTRIKPKKMIAC